MKQNEFWDEFRIQNLNRVCDFILSEQKLKDIVLSAREKTIEEFTQIINDMVKDIWKYKQVNSGLDCLAKLKEGLKLE